MYGYIYETTNLINGKKYIGQKKSHEFLGNKYLGSGNLIVKAINKYGRDNFEVKLLETCDTKDELNEKEIYYISKYKADTSNKYYNLSMDGSFNVTRKGKNHQYYHKHRSQETIDKIKQTLKDKYENTDLREKITKRTKEAMKRPEVIAKMSGKNNGTVKCGSPIKNKIMINNGEIDRYVLKEELQEFLDNGWELGGRKNRICITNKVRNKFVFEKDLKEYLDNGWFLGITTKGVYRERK